MLNTLWAVIERDIRLATRTGGHFWASLLFFTLILLLIPFALGPDPKTLKQFGPGLLWVATLLTTVIGTSSLFAQDRDDGSLTLLRSSAPPLSALILAKGLSHWVTTGLPLAISAPILGLSLNLSLEAIMTLALALLIGTFALAFIGLIGASLTLRLSHQNSVLAPLITLPLSVPILIFGVSASQETIALSMPGIASQALLLLCATSCIMFLMGLCVAVCVLHDYGT